MTNSKLRQLLQTQHLWLGRASPSVRPQANLATGYAALDAALHHGGWPRAGSVELLCDPCGIGELSLLLPALAGLSHKHRIAWLNPPFVPYAPALQQQGLHLPACLVVHTAPAQQSWAAEQLLRSAVFTAVLTWSDNTRLPDRELRRLQVAAREHQCWHSHFRPLACRQQSSPATLRIALQGAADRLQLDILKQTGGWSGQRVEIPRDPRLLMQQLPIEDWPAPTYGTRRANRAKPPARLRLLPAPATEQPANREHTGAH